MTRLTRQKAIFFDNDATSCYDRIPVFISNVISRKYGMNRTVCMVEGRTLAVAKYHLKTRLGISESYIQHCKAHPIFGVGQGSSTAAFKWLFMSSTLVYIYDSMATGAKYVKINAGLEMFMKTVAYVDDDQKSFNMFDRPNSSMQDLADIATKESQTWNDLLLVCNQALELLKCGYHAVEYNFDAHGEPKIIDNQMLLSS
jgi:hypothetical protein